MNEVGRFKERKLFQVVSVISLGWNCREGELKKEEEGDKKSSC